MRRRLAKLAATEIMTPATTFAAMAARLLPAAAREPAPPNAENNAPDNAGKPIVTITTTATIARMDLTILPIARGLL